jgi:molybdopterin converting factor small subunit
MKVDIKCFATLANPDTCDYNDSTAYELEDGQTVENLIHHVGIKREDVKIAFVNSRVADLDTELFDGDRVGLTPTTAALHGGSWFQK